MYTINTNKEDLRNKYITVNGEEDLIQDNISLTAFNFEIGEKSWYEITIKNKEEKTAKLRKYEPLESASDKAKNAFIAPLVSLMHAINGPQYTLNANDFNDLVQKIHKEITTKKANLRAKMSLKQGNDGKIYTEIATFSPFSNMNQQRPVLTAYDKQCLELLKRKDVALDEDPPTKEKCPF